MRILVAPDRLDEGTGAADVAAALARGWRAGAPADDVVALPLGDGGPGLVAGLHAARGGDLLPVTVAGPLGEPTPAVLLAGDDEVVVEAAQACGSHLVDGAVDRRRTTSLGVGQLVAAALAAARATGVRRVVVGTGGCVAHDGGAGLLAGLGLAPDACAHGAAGLAGVGPADLAPAGTVIERRGGVDVVVAVDTDEPLLGLHGISAALAPARGVPGGTDLGQELERLLGGFVHATGTAGWPGARAAGVAAGSGAGGGVGFALAVLGGRLVPGARVVAESAGLAAAVRAADLVVTAEGSLDPHSLHGSVVQVVAEHAVAAGVPVVAVPRELAVGRREWAAAGLAGVYPVAETFDELDAALADPLGTLERRVARVARTWSR